MCIVREKKQTRVSFFMNTQVMNQAKHYTLDFQLFHIFTDLLRTVGRRRQPVAVFQQVNQVVDDHLALFLVAHLLHEYLHGDTSELSVSLHSQQRFSKSLQTGDSESEQLQNSFVFISRSGFKIVGYNMLICYNCVPLVDCASCR